jgi:hypothetical protein
LKRAIIIALAILIVLGIGLYSSIARMASPGAIKLREYTNLSLFSKDKLQIEDFQIGGIKLEQSILDIQKSTLGKPTRKYSDRKNEFETYEYPGLKIEFNIITKHIVWIMSERKDLKTFRGISVGDKEEEVI